MGNEESEISERQSGRAETASRRQTWSYVAAAGAARRLSAMVMEGTTREGWREQGRRSKEEGRRG